MPPKFHLDPDRIVSLEPSILVASRIEDEDQSDSDTRENSPSTSTAPLAEEEEFDEKDIDNITTDNISTEASQYDVTPNGADGVNFITNTQDAFTDISSAIRSTGNALGNLSYAAASASRIAYSVLSNAMDNPAGRAATDTINNATGFIATTLADLSVLLPNPVVQAAQGAYGYVGRPLHTYFSNISPSTTSQAPPPGNYVAPQSSLHARQQSQMPLAGGTAPTQESADAVGDRSELFLSTSDDSNGPADSARSNREVHFSTRDCIRLYTKKDYESNLSDYDAPRDSNGDESSQDDSDEYELYPDDSDDDEFIPLPVPVSYDLSEPGSQDQRFDDATPHESNPLFEATADFNALSPEASPDPDGSDDSDDSDDSDESAGSNGPHDSNGPDDSNGSAGSAGSGSSNDSNGSGSSNGSAGSAGSGSSATTDTISTAFLLGTDQCGHACADAFPLSAASNDESWVFDNSWGSVAPTVAYTVAVVLISNAAGQWGATDCHSEWISSSFISSVLI